MASKDIDCKVLDEFKYLDLNSNVINKCTLSKKLNNLNSENNIPILKKNNIT